MLKVMMHDNLEVLKIMRKVEQKTKFRTTKNEIDLITEIDVSIRIWGLTYNPTVRHSDSLTVR